MDPITILPEIIIPAVFLSEMLQKMKKRLFYGLLMSLLPVYVLYIFVSWERQSAAFLGRLQCCMRATMSNTVAPVAADITVAKVFDYVPSTL